MRATWVVLAAGAAACLLGCSGDDGATDGGRDGRDGRDLGGSCTDEGAWRCSGTVAERCVGGEWTGAIDCAESGRVCEPDLGCVVCRPGHTFCDGNDVRTCSADGMSSEVTDTCDPAAGETCDAASGVCISPCAIAARDRSNIGCEYWAVDMDNAENRAPLMADFAARAQFAVVVANLGDLYTADVVVERDTSLPGEPHADPLELVDSWTLDPGDLHVFNLPRWDLDGDNPEGFDNDPQTTLSRRVYRITSTVPVVAYAFQPIEQAYSNGAMVLLPTTGLDTEYYVVLWPPANPMGIPTVSEPNRDYVTIVGVEDETTVRVTPTYDIMAGVGADGLLPVDAITAGTETEFHLDRFDVLNLENRAMASLRDPLPDLTGTVVRSSVPVAVFAGVDLAGVGDKTMPDGSTEACCAEFMGAQIAPTSAMGTNFVVSRSPSRSAGAYLEYDYYRIMAVRPATTVHTTLPDAGLDEFTLENAGDYFEFSTTRGFTLWSDGELPVHVVQYLTARDQCYDWRPSAGGDPDMTYIPPVEQRRTNYIFATGVGFSENWAVVSMPEGAAATIDGVDVESSCGAPRTDGELGGVDYRAFYCPISDGRHEVVSGDTTPVGVMVFGYYNAGSYEYPAGSELRRIFFG